MSTPTHTATDPAHSCSVLASAGTGKTWQLVARLTRLLLHGARLDSILAITFTRKAAGEMQQRLSQRLRELLEADDIRLDELLTEIGESPTPDLRRQARGLFEATLRSEQRLRASTFHSFCQDLLQRFPLEADLPPGFELAEQTGLLTGEAWDALFAEATAAPQQPLAAALTQLFDRLNGLHNTRQALFNFVDHRSDWWAYTQDSEDPVMSAIERLQSRLEVTPDIADGTALWNIDSHTELAEFLALLQKHDTENNRKAAQQLDTLLAVKDTVEADHAINTLYPLFFTGSDTPRKRKSNKAQQKSMGTEGEARFLRLHTLFCERLDAWREHHNRQRTLDSNSAWYRAGARMLTHYQRIKRERRLLDFADLEWHAYRLLNHPEHAHWIQYKLDQRIDHLLIDEFQDTNPTQWRLILPLLEEIAAGGERQRSLFIVGDAKQSIYRFRRGNPRLLGCAADWMQGRLSAARVHLDHSWRSSPLIMDCVNTLFQHPDMQGLLEDFQPHTTHRDKLWGRVELWPLIEADRRPADDDSGELRNPLLQPRPHYSDRRHYREGEAIATRIRQLVDDGTADYGDIMILMRSRTHLAEYEAALRDRHIPYLSLDRGTLLQSLEIRDLEALLQVLITPQDNLALAQVLRSPVFSVGDAALMRLANRKSGSWYERLQALAADTDNDQPLLTRAARLLTGWHALAGRVPIHDLLQQIFHQANLAARFEAAFPATQAARVQANLTRFIELALEVDAGRYPTLPRFLERLRQLRSLDKEGPSQATPSSDDSRRVQLLTIHAAKGLEAPVVFLADSARGTAPRGPQTLVRWPAEADRPTDFMLLSNSKQRDSISRRGYELEQQEEQRETANLLYVALTRARHMLVISGCSSDKKSRTPAWYTQLANALCGDSAPTEVWTKDYLKPPARPLPTPTPTPTPDAIDARLHAPLHVAPVWREIAPSHRARDSGGDSSDADGALRGLVIHRLLQLAADQRNPASLQQTLLHQVANEYPLEHTDSRLQTWWQEVLAVLTSDTLAWLMHPGPGCRTYNEVPVQFRQEQRTVFGIIDRLVIDADRIHLVDYKSHRLGNTGDARCLADDYRPQMALYREAIQRLWPDRPIRSYLLLTHAANLIELD